ncbi:hypothetical protein K456DRAFT_1327372 [Colletotrichum gloeosporioides 23]|nr:hypothetical protein K456DRAFT_1327372 [Colletotrichum gloeosporioides 23]
MELATDFPLFDYAINRWYEHATKAGPEGVVGLECLFEAIFSTGWEIYRRVTFTNTPTRYNPFQKSNAELSTDQNELNHLCKTCQALKIESLQTSFGFKHRCYDDLVVSSSTCKSCNMMRHALLEFALSRHSQQLTIATITDCDAASLKMEIDWRIRKTAGNMAIKIRTETRDPFLLINCSFYVGRLFLFQHPKSFGSTEILGKPTYDFHTKETFRTCIEWLQVCQMTHPECELGDLLPLLPTRVIKISESSLQLVQPQPFETGQYATLTHCWGQSQPTCLLMSNLQEFSMELRWESLSRVIQDCITIARNLNIQYVWIDALCIIQDSFDDWKIHSSAMPGIYANATLNVVSGGEDSRSGFLRRRISPTFSPVCIDDSKNVHLGWLGTESYCDAQGLNVVRYADGWRYLSPPHTRAWTLQEIRLARRNLVFQADTWLGNFDSETPTLLNSQLYMQCQKEIKWDTGRKRQGAPDLLTDWYNLAEDYSEQRLTRSSDRLLGLTAVAKKHAEVNKHCGNYLAGIWSNELLSGLLWRTKSSTDYLIEQDRYVAPSWSWAKDDVPIEFLRPGEIAMTATVSDYSTEPISDDIYGAVKNGNIVLGSNFLSIEPVDGHWAPWDGNTNVIITNEQHQERSVRIRYTLDYHDIVGPVYALNITRQAALLLQGSRDDSVHWVRIGVMKVARNDLHEWELTAQPLEVTIV